MGADEHRQPDRKGIALQGQATSHGGPVSVLDLAKRMNDEKAPLIDTSPLPTGTPAGPSIMEAARKANERPRTSDTGPIMALARKLNEQKKPLAREDDS